MAKIVTSGSCDDALPSAGEGALGRRLLTPARSIALEDLPDQWFHSVVMLRCRGAADLTRHPRFVGKIRGAWGEALKATASPEALADQPCPWQPPCPLDVFFRKQGKITGGLEIPKPYVMALIPDGCDLLIRLSIFGFATDWTEMAAEALVRACREKLNVRPRLQVTDRQFWSGETIVVERTDGAIIIAFETPLRIRDRDKGQDEAEPGEVSEFRLETLVATLGNRISGLARWQDAGLRADIPFLKSVAARCSVRQLQRSVASWRRYSRRQGHWIPMGGYHGVMLIEGDLEPLLPLLAIGETTHVGSHVSLGLGRYTLFVPR